MKVVPPSHYYACVILDVSVAELISSSSVTWMDHQQCNSLLKLYFDSGIMLLVIEKLDVLACINLLFVKQSLTCEPQFRWLSKTL